MTKYITEVLKELNDNVSLLNTTYKRTNNNSVLGMLFEYAYMPENKFVLPTGTPPFKPHTSPLGMTPAIFIQEIRKFDIFTRKDLTNFKREMLFVQLLENLHPQEAKILLAIKDQTLNELYPNLTYDVLAKAGYLPPRVVPITPEVAPEIVTKVTPKVTPKPRAKKVVAPVEEPSQENLSVLEA